MIHLVSQMKPICVKGGYQLGEIHVGSKKDVLNPKSLTFDERKNQIEEIVETEKEQRERLKKSPYSSFVQFNKDMYKAEDWLLANSTIAYRVLKFLINNMDGYNAVICSQVVLQEALGVSRVTVSRAISLLKERSFIDVYKSGTSNVYCINKNLAWNSWGSNFAYAKFGANIILSESEQEAAVQRRINAEKEMEMTIGQGV